MKDFFERCHGSVGHSAVHRNKKVCHVALPPCIDFSLGHTSAGVLEVFGLEISDQKTVRAQEQLVIIPSCLAERVHHFRPDRAVTFFVLLKFFRLHLQHEADTLHRFPFAIGCRDCAARC